MIDRPRERTDRLKFDVGAWLSLVERTVRDREVGGSNPLAPTILKATRSGGLFHLSRQVRVRDGGKSSLSRLMTQDSPRRRYMIRNITIDD